MRTLSRMTHIAVGAFSLMSVALSPALAGTIEINDPGQTPPKDETSVQQQTQQPPEPVKCIVDDARFWNGDKPSFKISLRNNCETRIRCTVSAYVVTSFGPKQGQGTLILEPKSKGAKSFKTWSLRLKDGNGSANASHKCVDL